MVSWLVRRLGVRGAKRAGIGAAGVLVVAVFSRPVLAADMSGQWELSCQVENGHQPLVLDVVQSRGDVSGSLSVVTAAGRSVRTAVDGRATRDGHFRLGAMDPASQPRRAAELTGRWYLDHVSGELKGAFGSCVFEGDRAGGASPVDR